MYHKSKIDSPARTQTLFHSLFDLLSQQHPLYLLSDKIDWHLLEDGFISLYYPDNGRPTKPIRLMCGLLIIKHIRNLSDDSVVEQWSENAYYQYFCGQDIFIACFPCNATDLVHFRKRIGVKGVELILQESIRVNDDDSENGDNVAFIDSTLQEKNITYPTDAKLHKKIIKRCQQISWKVQSNIISKRSSNFMVVQNPVGKLIYKQTKCRYEHRHELITRRRKSVKNY